MLRIVNFHGDEGYIAYLAALCPACNLEHEFRVDLEEHGKWKNEFGDKDVWEFNGNYDSPTFSPSMLANKNNFDVYKPICHSIVKNGVWEFLDDCTHEMAGQDVPMIPPDPDMSWKKRNGWHLYPWTDNEGNPKEE